MSLHAQVINKCESITWEFTLIVEVLSSVVRSFYSHLYCEKCRPKADHSALIYSSAVNQLQDHNFVKLRSIAD